MSDSNTAPPRAGDALHEADDREHPIGRLIGFAESLLLKGLLLLGGLVLLVEGIVYVISGPHSWLTIGSLARIDPDGVECSIWLVEAALRALLTMPAFIALPLTGIAIVIAVYFLRWLVSAAWRHVFRLLQRLFQNESAQPKKHIAICIDGTWNHPGKIDRRLDPQATNVYKLWVAFEGERNYWSEYLVGANRLKTAKKGPDVEQVALYYFGVGNAVEHTQLGQTVGGAFGFGASRILRRVYRDLTHFYNKGDTVSVYGFSRGAAIARWFCSYVEKQGGVPRFSFSDIPILRFLLVPISKLIHTWREVKIDFLGVWDTVASFGMSKDMMGIPMQKINLFKDFHVSNAVKVARHMVSIDETRDAFMPTLMEPDPKGECDMEETWFAGVHANVGGGFANTVLSDITLRYLVAEIEAKLPSAKIDEDRLRRGILTLNVGDERGTVEANDSMLYAKIPRPIPDPAFIHRSVIDRMKNPELAYSPEALALHLEHLERQRGRENHDLDFLKGQDLITEEERQAKRKEIEDRTSLFVREPSEKEAALSALYQPPSEAQPTSSETP